jgi:antitoxin FitA
VTVLTIRDVPEDVKEALALEAKRRGQSVQAYVLGVLERQARFGRNRQLLDEIEGDLAAGGGAGNDAPDAAEVLAQARAGRDARGTT